MKKIICKIVVRIGEIAAKRAVCASSPAYCYQSKEPEEARKKFTKNK